MTRKFSGGAFSRRQILKYSAASVAAIEMTGMPFAFAESNFTIGSTGGTWGAGIRDAFVDTPGFAETVGVAVSELNAPTAALVSRLIAQPSNPPFSVADLLDVEHLLAAEAGVIQDYDLDIVTNYEDIYPSAQQPPRAGLQNWCASMTLPIISFTYNTENMAAPTSWEDLWAPSLKGRIAIPDFGWYGLTWLHALNKTLGGDETNIDAAIAAVSDLVKQNDAVVLQNQEQVISAFTNQEIWAMPYWNGRVFGLKEAGVPVEMAYVPGTIQLHNGMVIAKQTSFQREANLFVNNTLDPELQLIFARRFNYPPANSKAVLPPDMEHLALPANALDSVVPLDWSLINDGRVEALDRWNREILG